MSIYSFSDIELQAYKNIWIAIQNYDVHAELPAIDSEKVLTLYKKVLSESKSGYMYNQNQIRMDCTCYRLCCGLVTIMCWKYNIYH